jgi:hypothetical protein
MAVTGKLAALIAAAEQFPTLTCSLIRPRRRINAEIESAFDPLTGGADRRVADPWMVNAPTTRRVLALKAADNGQLLPVGGGRSNIGRMEDCVAASGVSGGCGG